MKWITFKGFIMYLPLAGIGIVFFLLPYYYEQSLSTGIFKTDFYLIWIVGCFCWLYNSLFSATLPERIGKISILGIIYVFVMCLLKFLPDQNSLYVLITLFSCIGIIYFLRLAFASPYYYLVLIAVLGAFLFQVFIGYWRAFENDLESLSIKGQLYNSGFFGNYLAGIIPLLFAAFFNKRFRPHVRYIFLIGFIAVIILLFLTCARAAIIGTLSGCFVVFLLLRKLNIRHWISVTLTSLLIASLLIIILYNLKPASARGRLTIYKVSLSIINDNSITGVGPNRFSAIYNNYQSHFFKNEQSPVSTQLLATNTFEAFNLFIQILVEYGIIGLFLFLWIVFQLIKNFTLNKNVENKDWMRIGSAACIVAIIMSSLFSNPLHVTPVILIFCYHLSVVLPVIKTPSSLIVRRHYLSLLFISVPVFIICYYGLTQYKASVAWHKASESAKYDDFSRAHNYYRKAYPYMKFNGDFLFNYGAEAFFAKDYLLSIDLLERSKKFSSSSNIFVYLGNCYTAINQFVLAEQNYLHAIYMVPSNIYPKYQLIKLYKIWGKKEQMELWKNKTLSFPIKIKSEFSDELINELKKL